MFLLLCFRRTHDWVGVHVVEKKEFRVSSESQMILEKTKKKAMFRNPV